MLLILLAACKGGGSAGDDSTPLSGDDSADMDKDGDGFAAAEDCDDDNAAINPGATEISYNGIDDDCDAATPDDDLDGDGFGAADDCDDTEAGTFPGADELCDDVDQDCDQEIDNDAGTVWYGDADGDGYGDSLAPVQACEQPAGTAKLAGDCDDTDADSHPGGVEVCDEADNDCDNGTDEGVTTTYYQDGDGDGHGLEGATTQACDVPTGYADLGDDCDDTDPTISPSDLEYCDDVDNDCDGDTDEDEAEDASTWYADSDKDSYGDPDVSDVACDAPTGYVADATDCDDSDSTLTPKTTWYLDYDGDGYGNASFTLTQCEGPKGYVRDSSDCDDTDAALNPTTTWYKDTDKDGYGGSSTTTQCAQPSGYELTGGDCNDSSSSIYPGAAEYCDTTDQDCDGDVDDPDSVDADTWYEDSDGDGYGTTAATTTACSEPSGYTDNADDCDDAEATAYPDSHETETPYDGIDTDCDGDDFCHDLNCDGYPDVVAANYQDASSSTIIDSYVYYGSASGYSTSNRDDLATQGPSRAVVEDIDGDGYIDLLFPSYYDGNYTTDSYIYWGSASGYSSASRTDLAGYGVWDACISDVNGDGYKDVFLLSYKDSSTSSDHSTTSYLYWGSASGFSTSSRVSLSHYSSLECSISDLDGDGYEEIVTGTYYDGSNSTNSIIWWGSSSGYSSADITELATYRAYDVAIEDIDADGWEDIYFANYYDGDDSGGHAQYIYWGSSKGYSSSDRTSLSGYRSTKVEIEDADEDGRLDVIMPSYYDGNYSTTSYLYYQSATGFSTSNRSSFTTYGAQDAEIADMNGDGYNDLAFANHYTGSAYKTSSYVYWGSSSGFSSSSVTSLTTYGAMGVEVADLDGDGYPELLYSGYYDGSTYSTYAMIYTGSSSGYSSSKYTALPVEGMYNRLVVVGAD